MKACTFTKFQFFLTNCSSGSPLFTPLHSQNTIHLNHQTRSFTPHAINTRQAKDVQTNTVTGGKSLSSETMPKFQNHSASKDVSLVKNIQDGNSRPFIIGAVSVGVMLLLMGMDDHDKALAFGPEGPLVEEFWDNVRRYALYALTVSTGALYTILQPIFELLKNPISAVLVVVIIGGSFFIVSQVINAMVGVTDFAYDYAY